MFVGCLGLLVFIFGVLIIVAGWTTNDIGTAVIGILTVAFSGYLLEQTGPIPTTESIQQAEEHNKKIQESKRQLKRFLREVGLPEDTSSFRFRIDDYSYLCFFDSTIPYFLYAWADGYKKLPLNCIIETVSEARYTTDRTVERKGTVKRALVGGALAGGVGAVIGGTTGDAVISEDVTLVDAWMRIQTNEVQYRTFVIHEKSKTRADDDVAIVKAIKSKYGNTKMPIPRPRIK